MRRCRRVKIVATLGPASQEPHLIRRLCEAGVDVFRINMSHTDHATLTGYVEAIRDVERALARPIGILADLQGPKLRLGAMVARHLALFIGGKLEVAGLGEFCCASRPLRSQEANAQPAEIA